MTSGLFKNATKKRLTKNLCQSFLFKQNFKMILYLNTIPNLRHHHLLLRQLEPRSLDKPL